MWRIKYSKLTTESEIGAKMEVEKDVNNIIKIQKLSIRKILISDLCKTI
jgi:hypothetical protein